MASSKNRGFLPQTDAALLAWSVNFLNVLQAGTALEYGVSAAQITQYASLHAAFAAAYQTAKEPNTRTKPNVNTKDTAREALKNDARLLAQLVAGTATVTDAQKLSLGLNVRKTPSPVPAPTQRPGVDLISAIGFTVSIGIHDSSSKRGKPSGATAAWVYTYVGDTYPSDPTLWDFQGSTTKAKYDIVFDNFLPGGTQVWVCAAWINGEAGRWAGERADHDEPARWWRERGQDEDRGLNPTPSPTYAWERVGVRGDLFGVVMQ